MDIKATVCNNKKVKTTSYPCIKISTEGRVVLFTAPRDGVFLAGPSWRVGEQSKQWDETAFTPLEGHITLSNEDC